MRMLRLCLLTALVLGVVQQVPAGLVAGADGSPKAVAHDTTVSFDGTWHATLLVTSVDPGAPVPVGTVQFLDLNVSGTTITGDLQGSLTLTPQALSGVNGSVYVAEVSGSLPQEGLGYCSGEIYFSSQGTPTISSQFDDSISCADDYVCARIDGSLVSQPVTSVPTTTVPPASLATCVAASNCVLSLGSAPVVRGGTLTMKRAGQAVPISESTVLQANDVFTTNRTGVADLTLELSLAAVTAGAATVLVVLGTGTTLGLVAVPVFALAGGALVMRLILRTGAAMVKDFQGMTPEVDTSVMTVLVNKTAASSGSRVSAHAQSAPARYVVQVFKTHSCVQVLSGSIYVTNRFGKPVTRTVAAGYETIVKAWGAPSAPKRVAVPAHPFWQ